MAYRYESKIRPLDFWLLSMYHTYHSMVGMCNIIFGVAMILLTYRFWEQAGQLMQALLFLACLIIPVLQPFGVYLKAKAQTNMIPQGTELAFDKQGIHVALDGAYELVGWNRVKGVKKEWNMIVIFTGGGRGYMLTDRVLGNEKEEFYNYMKAHVKAS